MPPDVLCKRRGILCFAEGLSSIIGQLCYGAMTLLYRFCYRAEYPTNFRFDGVFGFTC
jgi:hypothetical protein